MIRTFTPMMASLPVSQPMTIRHTLEILGDRVELRPIYQRDIRWTFQNMCDLIMAVMCSGFIPGILLYRLQTGDERSKESYEMECIDGQHRLFTLLHFFNSRLVELPDKKPFLIRLLYKDPAGNEINLFYKKSVSTEIWESENRDKRVDYMSTDEQRQFNNYKLDIREIECPLTLDQRRGLFISLQKGIPVRNSDLYKNMTSVPIVGFISDTLRLEEQMKALMLAHLCSKPKNYWLSWAVRCYLIQQAGNPDDQVMAFMKKDSEINQMIKNNHFLLQSTPSTEVAFKSSIARFFSFLSNLEPGVKLTPCQFFATFTHLLDAEHSREKILSSHMRGLSTPPTGCGDLYKKHFLAWENRGVDDDIRRDFFERTLDEFERITVEAPPKETRKNIPKKVREAVWAKEFGEATIGFCVCCKEEISSDNWEAAHIVAHACGGKDNSTNIRPTCRTCNRSMGTENLWAFKARCYPDDS
uniref:HNH nuclease domain-containing protein n=1 Tax=viral metagenome TaxID=1070528 RepID=A0A6C0K6B7_9ZZZZ